MTQYDRLTAHAKCLLQDLARELADAADAADLARLDDDRVIVERVIWFTARHPVLNGTAAAGLLDFAYAFADVYGRECPDSHHCSATYCVTCGAAEAWGWYDHACLDYGRAFAYAVSTQQPGFARRLFPDPRLQPSLTSCGPTRAHGTQL